MSMTLYRGIFSLLSHPEVASLRFPPLLVESSRLLDPQASDFAQTHTGRGLSTPLSSSVGWGAISHCSFSLSAWALSSLALTGQQPLLTPLLLSFLAASTCDSPVSHTPST